MGAGEFVTRGNAGREDSENDLSIEIYLCFMESALWKYESDPKDSKFLTLRKDDFSPIDKDINALKETDVGR